MLICLANTEVDQFWIFEHQYNNILDQEKPVASSWSVLINHNNKVITSKTNNLDLKIKFKSKAKGFYSV